MTAEDRYIKDWLCDDRMEPCRELAQWLLNDGQHILAHRCQDHVPAKALRNQ